MLASKGRPAEPPTSYTSGGAGRRSSQKGRCCSALFLHGIRRRCLLASGRLQEFGKQRTISIVASSMVSVGCTLCSSDAISLSVDTPGNGLDQRECLPTTLSRRFISSCPVTLIFGSFFPNSSIFFPSSFLWVRYTATALLTKYVHIVLRMFRSLLWVECMRIYEIGCPLNVVRSYLDLQLVELQVNIRHLAQEICGRHSLETSGLRLCARRAEVMPCMVSCAAVSAVRCSGSIGSGAGCPHKSLNEVLLGSYDSDCKPAAGTRQHCIRRL